MYAISRTNASGQYKYTAVPPPTNFRKWRRRQSKIDNDFRHYKLNHNLKNISYLYVAAHKLHHGALFGFKQESRSQEMAFFIVVDCCCLLFLVIVIHVVVLFSSFEGMCCRRVFWTYVLRRKRKDKEMRSLQLPLSTIVNVVWLSRVLSRSTMRKNDSSRTKETNNVPNLEV